MLAKGLGRIGVRASAVLRRPHLHVRSSDLRLFATREEPATAARVKGLTTEGTVVNLTQKTDTKGVNFDVTKLSIMEDVVREADMDEKERADFERLGSFDNANAKELFAGRVAALVAKYQRFPNDTGSSEVQIAILTDRLKYLEEHLKKHTKDKHTKRGRNRVWHRRRKLLLYIRRDNFEQYERVMTDFDIDEHELLTYGHLPGKLNRPRRLRGFPEGQQAIAKREQAELEQWEADRASWSVENREAARERLAFTDRRMRVERRKSFDKKPQRDGNRFRHLEPVPAKQQLKNLRTYN
jgi:small subunit ribosomal protein S15